MKLAHFAMIVGTIALPQMAIAQGQTMVAAPRMDCPGTRAKIAVPSMRLNDALAKFGKIYRCGVSVDAGKVGDMDAGDLNSTLIKGRYTPLQALRIMTRNSPLKVKQIKGGFSIYQ